MKAVAGKIIAIEGSTQLPDGTQGYFFEPPAIGGCAVDTTQAALTIEEIRREEEIRTRAEAAGGAPSAGGTPTSGPGGVE